MGEATHGARGGTPPGGRPRRRVAVLASGEGSLLQAVLDAGGTGATFEVVLVASDRADAPALARARRCGVPTAVVLPREHPDRAAWDAALAARLREHRPEVLVLAGFRRLLGPATLAGWPDAIINSHPSLLPAFPGALAVSQALAAGVAVTGASVIAVDAGVDTGPVLEQRRVDVSPGDTPETLHERIRVVERPLLVEVLTRVAADGATSSYPRHDGPATATAPAHPQPQPAAPSGCPPKEPLP